MVFIVLFLFCMTGMGSTKTEVPRTLKALQLITKKTGKVREGKTNEGAQ